MAEKTPAAQLTEASIPYENGDHYAGQINADNKPHGAGMLRYATNEYYSGQWVNGAQEGFGEQNFGNGDRYEGAFASG